MNTIKTFKNRFKKQYTVCNYMISYIENLLPNYLIFIKIENFYETYNDNVKIFI